MTPLNEAYKKSIRTLAPKRGENERVRAVREVPTSELPRREMLMKVAASKSSESGIRMAKKRSNHRHTHEARSSTPSSEAYRVGVKVSIGQTSFRWFDRGSGVCTPEPHYRRMQIKVHASR